MEMSVVEKRPTFDEAATRIGSIDIVRGAVMILMAN